MKRTEKIETFIIDGNFYIFNWKICNFVFNVIYFTIYLWNKILLKRWKLFIKYSLHYEQIKYWIIYPDTVWTSLYFIPISCRTSNWHRTLSPKATKVQMWKCKWKFVLFHRNKPLVINNVKLYSEKPQKCIDLFSNSESKSLQTSSNNKAYRL